MSWETNISNIGREAALPPQCDYKKPLAITGVVLLCLAVLVATYFWDPTFQGFVNSTFSKVQSALVNVHLSVPQALLYIALPVGGLALAMGCIAHVHRTHQRRLEDREPLLDDEAQSSLLYTLKEMQPTAREWAIAGVVAAVLVVMGIGGFAVFQYVPQANQWIEKIFGHQFELWQAIAYVGGGTVGTALLTGLVIRSIQCANAHREEQLRWEAQNVEHIDP